MSLNTYYQGRKREGHLIYEESSGATFYLLLSDHTYLLRYHLGFSLFRHFCETLHNVRSVTLLLLVPTRILNTQHIDVGNPKLRMSQVADSAQFEVVTLTPFPIALVRGNISRCRQSNTPVETLTSNCASYISQDLSPLAYTVAKGYVD